jgi:hypothetical protein
MKNKNNTGLSKRLSVDAAAHSENYLSFGFYNDAIGQSSLSATPSRGYNDLIFNGLAHMPLGTGTNLRLGKHVLFTYLRLRLFITTSSNNRFRILVGRSQDQDDIAQLNTTTTIAAKIESDVLEPPLQGAGPILCDTMVSPSTEYQILYDKMCGWGTDFTSVENANTQNTMVCVTIPIMVQRFYKQDGYPDKGDWFLHLSSSNPSAGCYVYGTARMDFINQWDWESIPRAIKTGITYADDVLQHASKSVAVKTLLGVLRYGAA